MASWRLALGRFGLVVSLSLASVLVPSPAGASSGPPSVTGVAAIVADLNTGQVLWAKNPHEELEPASITKIMTALVALTYGPSLGTVITVPAQAQGVPGSSVYLRAGEKLTFKDLLYGLILRSGNDAAVAIAIATAGSVPAFVAMMNAECKKLGCENTHFNDPNGLSTKDHYTSVADMALITEAAMKIPEFRRIVSTKLFTSFPNWPAPGMFNQDKLLWNYPGAIGVKIGYTDQAHETIVGAATRHGVTLVAVVMHTTHPRLWLDPETLLTWGFDNFVPATALARGQVVGHVKDATGKTIPVISTSAVSYLRPVGGTDRVKVALVARRHPDGPVRKGEPMGYAEITVNGQIMSLVPAVAGENYRPPASALWAVATALALLAAGSLVRHRRHVRRTSRWRYRGLRRRQA